MESVWIIFGIDPKSACEICTQTQVFLVERNYEVPYVIIRGQTNNIDLARKRIKEWRSKKSESGS